MNGYLRYSRAMLLQLSADEMHGSSHGVLEETTVMLDTGHPGKHSGITPGCTFPWF